MSLELPNELELPGEERDPDASRWESKSKPRKAGRTLDPSEFADRMMSGDLELPEKL